MKELSWDDCKKLVVAEARKRGGFEVADELVRDARGARWRAALYGCALARRDHSSAPVPAASLEAIPEGYREAMAAFALATELAACDPSERAFVALKWAEKRYA